MIALSIALVIIAFIAGYLINKYLDQRKIELDRAFELNNKSASADISAAIEEGLNKFDDRINRTWGTISEVKQDLNSLKMQIGLKGIK